MENREIILNLTDKSVCKTIQDPTNPELVHMETILPFSEAVKLEIGNANVRPPTNKKPYKAMIETAEKAPKTFHVKNRGITYLCDNFEYDEVTRRLKIVIPDIPDSKLGKASSSKFGIADGGHTFDVIRRTVNQTEHLQTKEGWTEPFVRVHLLRGESEHGEDVKNIVEALNTSLAVKQYTLDEYKHKFENLKKALKAADIDLDLVAFRENENREWHVVEIIQRLACFLKDRWIKTQPAQMYKSKSKALDLFTNYEDEFKPLYPLIMDIITFPEYIQSQLSMGANIEGRRLGKLRPVTPKKKTFKRAGTNYPSQHKMDIAALLPMASAFRELLVKRGDSYKWKLDPKKVFQECVQDLYDVLVNRSSKMKTASQLGSDVEYWSQCAQIVMRTKEEMLDKPE